MRPTAPGRGSVDQQRLPRPRQVELRGPRALAPRNAKRAGPTRPGLLIPHPEPHLVAWQELLGAASFEAKTLDVALWSLTAAVQPTRLRLVNLKEWAGEKERRRPKAASTDHLASTWPHGLQPRQVFVGTQDDRCDDEEEPPFAQPGLHRATYAVGDPSRPTWCTAPCTYLYFPSDHSTSH